jgi:hypothetical protein
MNLPTFEDFLNKNAKKEDLDIRTGKVSDGLLTNNVLQYHKDYMHKHGKDLLALFWSEKSDNCPLECEEAEAQTVLFESFVKNKF